MSERYAATKSQARILAAMLAMLFLTACGGGKHADFFRPKETSQSGVREAAKEPKLPFTREEAERGIAHSVIRKFIDDYSAAAGHKPQVLFLSVTANFLDPNSELLKGPPAGIKILPHSASTIASSEWSQSDRTVFLGIEQIDWIDLENVEATCSWTEAPSNTRRFFVYQLEWSRRKWVVQ